MRSDNPNTPAAFMTLPTFCNTYGFKLHAVRSAVNSGLLPVYTPFGSRRYIRADEALAFIKPYRKGGAA